MSARSMLIGGVVLLLVLALAFYIGVLFGGGGKQQRAENGDTQAPQAELVENTTQKEKTTSSGTAPLGTAIGLGETATFPDRTVTVNDVQHSYVFPSNIPEPPNGNEYILVNVTITNTTIQPIDVNSYNFEAEDTNGVRYGAVPTNAPPDAINAARVAPNGQLTGNLVFGVQQGDTSVKIAYRPY